MRMRADERSTRGKGKERSLLFCNRSRPEDDGSIATSKLWPRFAAPQVPSDASVDADRRAQRREPNFPRRVGPTQVARTTLVPSVDPTKRKEARLIHKQAVQKPRGRWLILDGIHLGSSDCIESSPRCTQLDPGFIERGTLQLKRLRRVAVIAFYPWNGSIEPEPEVPTTPNESRDPVRLLRKRVTMFTDPAGGAVCFVTQGPLTGPDASEDTCQYLAKKRAAIELALRDRFDRAIEAGELPLTVSAPNLARFYSVVIQGIALQAQHGGTQEQLFGVVDMAMESWPVRSRKRR